MGNTLTRQCVSCRKHLDGNPRQCPYCGNTIYRPIFEGEIPPQSAEDAAASTPVPDDRIEWTDEMARNLAKVMGPENLEYQLNNARYLQSRGYPEQEEHIARLENAIRIRDEDAAAAMPVPDDRIERLCEVLHDAYEAAAVDQGWQTQQASRKPWAEVPEANKATMRAAVRAIVPAVLRDAADAAVAEEQPNPSTQALAAAIWLRQRATQIEEKP